MCKQPWVKGRQQKGKSAGGDFQPFSTILAKNYQRLNTKTNRKPQNCKHNFARVSNKLKTGNFLAKKFSVIDRERKGEKERVVSGVCLKMRDRIH